MPAKHVSLQPEAKLVLQEPSEGHDDVHVPAAKSLTLVPSEFTNMLSGHPHAASTRWRVMSAVVTMASSSRKSGIRLNRPFVDIPSFLRARIETDLDALDALDANIAVYEVPFDEGSPFLADSRAAPRSVRKHSLRVAETDLGLYDPETRRTCLAYELANRAIADVGDVDVPETWSGGRIMATPTIRKFLQGPCFSAWKPENGGTAETAGPCGRR